MSKLQRVRTDTTQYLNSFKARYERNDIPHKPFLAFCRALSNAGTGAVDRPHDFLMPAVSFVASGGLAFYRYGTAAYAFESLQDCATHQTKGGLYYLCHVIPGQSHDYGTGARRGIDRSPPPGAASAVGQPARFASRVWALYDQLHIQPLYCFEL